MRDKRILNCAYSFNDNYAQHGGLSILSLFEHNLEADEINVYVLDNQIGRENKQRLTSMADQFGRKIIFLDFDELSKDMNVDTNFNRSAYGRLFLAQVENVDLMLYFDSDTIVAGSVLDLLDADMTGKPLAGVQDTVNPYFVHKVGMTDEDRYINSGGVLIFNLKLWREQGLEKKFVDYILSFNGNPPLDDQGTLNHVCKGSIKILPPEYNLMNPMFMYSVKRIKRLFGMKTYYTQEEIDEAKKHPKVIHYTAEFYNRPWFANCTHPMKQMYLDYLAKSPWSGNKPVFKELSKNCRIQNWVFEHCPFFVYICMIRFIQVRHILRG